MKKLFLLCSFILVVSLSTACKKDSSRPQAPDNTTANNTTADNTTANNTTANNTTANNTTANNTTTDNTTADNTTADNIMDGDDNLAKDDTTLDKTDPLYKGCEHLVREKLYEMTFHKPKYPQEKVNKLVKAAIPYCINYYSRFLFCKKENLATINCWGSKDHTEWKKQKDACLIHCGKNDEDINKCLNGDNKAYNSCIKASEMARCLDLTDKLDKCELKYTCSAGDWKLIKKHERCIEKSVSHLLVGETRKTRCKRTENSFLLCPSYEHIHKYEHIKPHIQSSIGKILEEWNKKSHRELTLEEKRNLEQICVKENEESIQKELLDRDFNPIPEQQLQELKTIMNEACVIYYSHVPACFKEWHEYENCQFNHHTDNNSENHMCRAAHEAYLECQDMNAFELEQYETTAKDTDPDRFLGLMKMQILFGNDADVL